jgi:hypothetical protein
MVVSGPELTDAVLDARRGVEVFVDRAAAEALDDQQLDVLRRTVRGWRSRGAAIQGRSLALLPHAVGGSAYERS